MGSLTLTAQKKHSSELLKNRTYYSANQLQIINQQQKQRGFKGKEKLFILNLNIL
jgi:hypothetical protein